MMESKVLGIGFLLVRMRGTTVGLLRRKVSREARLQQIAGDSVEDSVEEVDGLWGGISAAYFERFVDDDGGGGVGVADHRGDGGADEVAVDDGHAFDAPVLGVRFDEGVDLFLAAGGHAMEVFGEAPGLGVHVFDGGPEELADLFGRLLAEVALKEHLHGEFARFAAGAHTELSVLRYQLSVRWL